MNIVKFYNGPVLRCVNGRVMNLHYNMEDCQHHKVSGLSTSYTNVYISNILPWSMFAKYLYEHRYSSYEEFIVEQFEKANQLLLPFI